VKTVLVAPDPAHLGPCISSNHVNSNQN
jgi:hypothetical protein